MISYRRQRIQLTEAQLAKWTSRKVGSDLRVEGPCPACKHTTRGNVPTTVTAFEGAQAVISGDLTIALECACGEKHPGNPGDPVGCGRTWTALATVHPDATVAMSLQDDPYLEEAADAFRREQSKHTDQLRSAAEKWIPGISAILGIVGLIGLSANTTRVQELTAAGKYAVASVTLLAVLAGIAAVIQSYLAAYGWPVTRAVESDEELADWYAASREFPARLAGRLHRAAALAGLSAVALGVAAGLSSLLPSSTPEVASVSITRTDQSIVCGSLLNSDRDGTVLLRRSSDGTVIAVPVTKITKLAVVSRCSA